MSKTIEEIKEEYFKEIGFKSLDDAVMEIAIGMSKIGSASVLENHFTKIAQRYAQSQTQELLAWKESASKVLKNLDLQAIGKTLGIGLGEDISVNVLPKIKELQEHNYNLANNLLEMSNSLVELIKENDNLKDLSNTITGLQLQEQNEELVRMLIKCKSLCETLKVNIIANEITELLTKYKHLK